MKSINNLYKCFFNKITLLLLILTLPVSLSAADFGLVTNVFSGYSNSGETEDENENILELRFDILPRLSFFIGDNAEVFISGGLSLDKDNDFLLIPELLRTEFSWRSGDIGIRLGRINYTDPLSFVVSGLLDGFQLNYNSLAGRLSVGAWYTGLLYKKNADITMTDNDYAIYNEPVDNGSVFKNYFAPNRMIAALEWNHPSLGEFMQLNIAAICQFDLADSDKYNNQYFILKAGVPVNTLLFELGGGIELSQSDDQVNMAFAGDIGFSWMLPTTIVSGLSLTGKIAGWGIEDLFEPFTPITTKYFGNILKHKMTGLSVISLDYSARVAETFGINLSALYFTRHDLGSFKGYPIPENLDPDAEVYFLGPEFFARLIWSPLSDLQFNLGGGAFVPSLGNVGPDEKIQWRVELTAILALY